MKLRRFLHPLDTSFSTPQALRKLLRVLAWALLLCLVSTQSFFLNESFNSEVSRHRRLMNASMYEAQLFLYQRESLLEHLGRGVMFGSGDRPIALPFLSEPLPPHDYVTVALGDAAGRSLFLSGRDLRELREKNLSLLYVAPGPAATVSRLYDSVALNPVVPTAVLDALHRPGTEAERVGVRWLADPTDAKGRLYLFVRVSTLQEAGWLGLELSNAELTAAFDDSAAGDYLLLDRQHREILGSDMTPGLGEQFSALWQHDTFAFSRSGAFSWNLALLVHLGNSKWTLIRYVDLSTLLAPLWPRILLSLLLSLAAGGMLWGLCRRIERRLIEPDQRRLDALVDSEAFSSTVIQTAPVALCVLRRKDGEVVMENRLALHWLGEGEQRRRWSHAWIARAFDGEPGGATEELELAGGRHLHLSYAPTRYKGEDVLLCAFSDISARKQTEAALAEAKLTADAANAAKTLFLATMSHEIRTPLYGVLGTLELLGRTSLDAQQAGYLKAIQRSSSTLLQLIGDVLDVSKIEAGQLGLELVEFSPMELLEGVLQSYAAAARSKGLQLYGCSTPDLPRLLLGDATRIRQILNNLLSNALKFTDNGRVVVRVRVERREGERVTLVWQVADTGIGISTEAQRYLFDPFFQVGDHSRMAGGTGLGLSICLRLCNLMNGRLQVVSDVGLGSSFTLSLPLQALPSPAEVEPMLAATPVWVHSPVREFSESTCGWLSLHGARALVVSPGGLIEDGEDAVLVDVRFGGEDDDPLPDWPGCRVIVSERGHDFPQRQGCDWLVGRYNMAAILQAVSLAQGCKEAELVHGAVLATERSLGMRVLAVEDNPINQLILRDQLEELDCSVVLASNGLEALRLWQDGAFDVVLTDVNMPGMNGYQLARALRERGCRVPLIGTTANAMREEIERCLASGMNTCLVKPLDLHSLYGCLKPIQMEARECSPTES
ncbi:ATP-binding protein [Pseudomonas schmalbachii]|uniref:histidine kinase n=1 Tax=Pseudomonas schmalbachii TaxID=2816993 RepID=A0ABS3TWH8_9PSED|nr:ATP-binding protein [Pseudomonas schmalbachii]MBO3277688.1 response regulator [Pseudomonas schmalbachii]